MDRAYDSQRKKFLVKETIPKTEPPKKQSPTRTISKTLVAKDKNNEEKQTFSTHPLDEAMQELLDICQQYNDKLNIKRQDIKQPTGSLQTNNQEKKSLNTNNHRTTCDRKQTDKMAVERKQYNNNNNNAQNNFLRSPVSNSNNCGDSIESIELLQEKQAQLQRQLDEVLLVAKKLAFKQKKRNKLTDILEDQEDLEVQNITKKGSTSAVAEDEEGAEEEEEEEEDELIEFQQIENELRISDLKRQLDNIQEELRIRLFKRLVSNTTGPRQKSQPTTTTNGYSPSSSSASSSSERSPVPTVTSNGHLPIINEAAQALDAVDVGPADQQQKKSAPRSQDIYETTKANDEFQHSANRATAAIRETVPQMSTTKTESNCSSDDHDSAVDYAEALTPTTSKESVMSKKNPHAATAAASLETKDAISPYQAMSPYVHATSPVHSGSNHRNNSANSDLERIEEDEDEQEEDYYCSSDKFRTIYEEKLSPKALGQKLSIDSRQIKPQQTSKDSDTYLRQAQRQSAEDASKIISQQLPSNSSPLTGHFHDQLNAATTNRHDGANNRPLTLYMPKPDEEIDLVEHVQALGHDTDIISDDLRLGPKSAEGYLWKCCARNSKKWLKRYFYYDRESKMVAYFKSKSDLTKKKHPSPRDTIPFEEISDVYVDHRLSSLGGSCLVDHQSSNSSSSTKGRNFVFVLATIGRKYLLASSKAETMRAWIDILFMAAKANDYLEQLPLDGEDVAATTVAAAAADDVVNCDSLG